ncbi:hypothetical protein [Stratiformator vulcanicus]|uniref:Uncharacterized protein n=1 Tax=Stratiformator vulcanicus TaxID=2527980 RepID=A0A517R4F3_9PLAN|nr:hypothetical protein [Stratiformator vulcanicus]QDT38703.1 hypothetical protein Pan189_30990 [Stratiformator vulcanicus]
MTHTLKRLARGAFFAIVAGCYAASPAAAQGLIWYPPKEDGAEFRYEGTFEQTNFEPNSVEDTFTWDRRLTIRTFGPVDADFDGKTQPCWWLEFKLETGKISETGIDTGPAGPVLSKVLVPESAIRDQPVDELGLPVSFLPIVRGYIRVGNGPVQELEAKAFQVFPRLATLRHYRPTELTKGSESTIDTPAGSFTATEYEADSNVESRDFQVKNQATLFVSPEAGVGPVRWSSRTERSRKESTQPRATFELKSRTSETMELRNIGTALQSELITPGE